MVNLTTPACPMKAQIEREVRTALESRLPGEWAVNITMGAEVRGKGIVETGDIPGIKNVIAVGSGKGGVGKSTMAAAIAYGLRSYGASVGLMDADVYGPSIPHLVGASGRPMAKGERIQPIETGGFKLMSMGFLLEPERAVIMRGPMLHGIIQQFLRQVDWGPLDYLVIDLPPGTGDIPLTLAQSLPLTGAVVVCTPQEVALLDATRAISMFRQLKVPVLGMIENMSFFDVVAYLRDRGGPEAHKLIDGKSFFDTPGDERVYIFGRGGARRKAEAMGVPFLGEVPLNVFLRESGDEGRDGAGPGSRARRPGRICWVSSSSSPPRSASRTSRRPRCPSWRSSVRSTWFQPREQGAGLRLTGNGSSPPQCAPGRGAGRLAVFQGERPVDEHVVDPFGQGAAGGVGRAVGHTGRVEDGDIGDEAGADQAAVGQAKPSGGVRRQVGDGLGPGIIAELASVITQVAGKGSPAARVREAAAEDAVGARHVSRMAEDRPDVGLGSISRAKRRRCRPPCPRPTGSRRRSRPDRASPARPPP